MNQPANGIDVRMVGFQDNQAIYVGRCPQCGWRSAYGSHEQATADTTKHMKEWGHKA